MFNNISWGNYLSAIIPLLLVYYLIVGFTFYAGEIKNLLLDKIKFLFRSTTSNLHVETARTDGQPRQPELSVSNINDLPETGETNDTLQHTKELTHSLKNAIAEAVEKNYIKEEFILSLQLLLRNYTFLKGTPSLTAINNLIASECEKYGYIQLGAEEWVMLWNV